LPRKGALDTIHPAMTERLYYSDPYLKEFTARVVRKTAQGVVLDRTAFFPTGGGQPCDLGTLNGVEVTDVIEVGEDVVHAVAQPLEGELRGVIDWERRRDHMQQHHGQHLLSEAFLQVARAQTYGTAFLLPEAEFETEIEEWIAENATWLFEFQLSAWSDDEARWPADRGAKAFAAWFDVEIHDAVVDLAEADLETEEL